jgi:AraC-like DNA-binding protein
MLDAAATHNAENESTIAGLALTAIPGRRCERLETGLPPRPGNPSCLRCRTSRRLLHAWLSLRLTEKIGDLDRYADGRQPGGGHPMEAVATTRSCVANRFAAAASGAAGPCWETQGGRPVSCPRSANDTSEACPLAGPQRCPNRLSAVHYAQLAPAWIGTPAYQLFVSNIRTSLGAIRAERFLHDANGVSVGPVREAVRAILQSGGNTQTALKILSREVHLSSSYLAALFKQVVGTGFRRYVLSVRISYAAEMLIHSSAPVSEVAALLGYTATSNFVRDLHSQLGSCPAMFRTLYGREDFVWTCPSAAGETHRDPEDRRVSIGRAQPERSLESCAAIATPAQSA